MNLALLSLILSAFSWGQAQIPRKSDDDLTLLLAQQRKAQVKTVEYFLHFDLKQESKRFTGRATLAVELNRLDLPLSIDLYVKKINSVKVNGEPLAKYPTRKGSFDIPQKHLSRQMKIEVDYTGEYSQEASGFKRVVDPQDGAVYVYTDFEPYYAHWLFPSFDQPDLKGIFHVSVLAPKAWKVISNDLLLKTEEQGEQALFTFKPSKPISTYLFFLGGGPFVEWQDNYGDLPLYLYARKSLEKYVDAENIMKTTKAGLKFFNDYFNYPYPFSKYAHVFIPEFAWGGMENPGAVTLNERNIFRGPVPQTKYEKRDNLLMHEMAHMWFGDLVTMEWWNDLWLNESFASYLASMAQDRALNSKSTWMEFFHTKTWGYWQDQLVSTHPIETNVPDVRTAKGNFDGITYAKGASALKQLHFFVGESAFREGLRAYFKTYAFSNTRREDFIKAIALAAQADLSEWTAKWLQTAGPNRVRLEVDCDKKKVKKAWIQQGPSVSGTLSPHRTKVAAFELDDKKLELDEAYEVIYADERKSIKKMKRQRCPDFVFPNFEDYDYALFSLDERSLKHAQEALTTIADPLTRLMVWNILGQMVRDAELPPGNYMKLALEALKVEKEDLLLGNLMGRHSPLREQHYFLYLTPDERKEIAPEMELILWQRMEKAEKGSSLQMTFFDFYISLAQSPASQARLYNMLVKNAPPEGITLDQDRRWAIIINLAMNGHGEALKLAQEEVKKDNSTLGKRMAFVSRAAFPSRSEKQKMWKELFTNKELSHSDLQEAGEKIHHPNYPEMSRPFVDDYFKRVLKMDWKSHDDIVDVYFENFYPLELCSEEILKLSQKHLKTARNLTTLARRSWMEAQDELDRCVRVRARAARKGIPQ